jgi:positive regulator of sigma E activity
MAPAMKADIVTTEVRLVRSRDGSATLVPGRSSTCASCGLCGAIGNADDVAATIGAPTLRLSLPSRSLLLMALTMYGGPFAGLLAGALLGALLGAGDIGAAAIALVGFVLTGLAAGRFTRSLEQQALQSIGDMSTGLEHAGTSPRGTMPADVAR